MSQTVLTPANTSVIAQDNDLEARTILEIAQQLGCHRIVVPGDWGSQVPLSAIPVDLDLRDHVVVLELTEGPLIDHLRARAKSVYVLDHHAESRSIGQGRRVASALEQFARLMGHTLTKEERLVAAHDRDFFCGLMRAGATFEEACNVARRELEVRGELELFDQARRHFAVSARRLGSLTLVLAPDRLRRVMLRAAQWPVDEAGARVASRALVLLHAEGDSSRIVQVEYGGAAAEWAAIVELFGIERWNVQFSLWAGGGDACCYFGARARGEATKGAIDDLVSTLLSQVLGASWPLAGYECTFYLPLDLHLDAELETDTCIAIERGLPQRDERTHPWAEPQRIRRSSIGAKGAAGHDTTAKNAMATDAAASADEVATIALADANSTAPPGTAEYEAQAWHYLLPHLRESIFDTEPSTDASALRHSEPIRHWRLRGPTRWRLCVSREEQAPLEAQIAEVSLFRYFNGLYLFAIRTQPKEPMAGAWCDPWGAGWWRKLFEVNNEDFGEIFGATQLEEWLAFTKLARILYPSFRGQKEEGKITRVTLIDALAANDKQPFLLEESGQIEVHDNIGEEISPIVLALLARFFTRSTTPSAIEAKVNALRKRLDFVPDDRMFVNVAYNLAGPAPTTTHAKAEFDRLFSLALYADTQSDTLDAAAGFAYDKEFTLALMREHALLRWRDTGTLSGYSVYSNAYMGFGWFFAEVVGPVHVPHVYGRLLILSLFYQASLRHYRRRIGRATRRLPAETADADRGELDAALQAFRAPRRDFITFTNNYWFREVTSQIQGQEVFAKLFRGLGLDREYSLVKDQLERADEYVDAVSQSHFNRLADRAQWVAFAVAMFALLIGVVQTTAAITGWTFYGEHQNIFGLLDAIAWAVVATIFIPAAVLSLFKHQPSSHKLQSRRREG